MLHNLFSSHVVFRIINFGAFIGFFGFLFKRYLVPSIKKQIQEKKLLIQNLEQQKQGIKYQLSNLDNALEQQDYLAAELTKKIALWNEQEIALRHTQQQEENIVREKIEKKAHIQSTEQARKNLIKEVIPHVVVQVEKELQSYFDQKDHSQPFIKDIITFLQERSS